MQQFTLSLGLLMKDAGINWFYFFLKYVIEGISSVLNGLASLWFQARFVNKVRGYCSKYSIYYSFEQDPDQALFLRQEILITQFIFVSNSQYGKRIMQQFTLSLGLLMKDAGINWFYFFLKYVIEGISSVLNGLASLWFQARFVNKVRGYCSKYSIYYSFEQDPDQALFLRQEILITQFIFVSNSQYGKRIMQQFTLSLGLSMKGAGTNRFYFFLKYVIEGISSILNGLTSLWFQVLFINKVRDYCSKYSIYYFFIRVAFISCFYLQKFAKDLCTIVCLFAPFHQ